MKHHDQSYLGLISLCFHMIRGGQGRNLEQGRKLEEGVDAEAMVELLFADFLNLLSYRSQDHQLGDGTTYK